MRKLKFVLAAASAVTLSATPLSAQWGGILGRGSSSQSVPNGMCRVWIDGLSASQQPRPTDCRTAERQRAYYEQRYGRQARVLYGSNTNGRYDTRNNGGVILGKGSGSVYDRNGRVYGQNGSNCRVVERVVMGRVLRQNVCDNNGSVYDRNGRVYDRNGRVYDRNGNVVYRRGNVYDRNGRRDDRDSDSDDRHDRGKHKGWEKNGKHKGRS